VDKAARDLRKALSPKGELAGQLTPTQQAEAQRLLDQLRDAVSAAKGAFG
jgi:hypothetical protein